MEAPDNQSLQAEIQDTLAAARQYQSGPDASPLVCAVLDHLMGRLNEAQEQRQFEAVMGYHRDIKEVLAGPEKRERVSGQVQIITAQTGEEALAQCPWAVRAQPAGKMPHQVGKWVCFETDDDADFYRGL